MMDGNGAGAVGQKREYSSGSADGSGDGEGGSKRSRGSGPHVDMRILLPSRIAGSIIGKGGSNIKRLREEYNASVLVPDAQGPERVLTIATDLGSACEILTEILKGFEADRGIPDSSSEARFMIHQSQAGAVIGKGGQKVKELREQTNAQIKVYSECCPLSSERIIEVSGDIETIVKTAYIIYEFLETCRPKGFNALYDPHNFDEYFSLDYGGYTSADNGRGGRGRDGGRRGGRRGGGGRMGGGGLGLGALSGLFGGGRGLGGGGMRRGMRGGGLMGAPGFSGGSGYGGPGGLNFEAADPGETEFTQVSIPKEYAGAIIGKGGMRIKQIRMESGATITIEGEQADSTDRIINISGTSDQIQNAQFLLQMSVKQFANV